MGTINPALNSALNPALYWLIIGVMLFFLELAVPGFILFFFAVGAMLTALAAWLFPLSLAWQLALFICASLIALFGLRDIIQQRLHTPPSEGDKEEDKDVMLAVAGDKGVVSTAIVPPAEGRIKYSGTTWRAAADEKIEEGEIVAIVAQKGLVIHVEKI